MYIINYMHYFLCFMLYKNKRLQMPTPAAGIIKFPHCWLPYSLHDHINIIKSPIISSKSKSTWHSNKMRLFCSTSWYPKIAGCTKLYNYYWLCCHGYHRELRFRCHECCKRQQLEWKSRGMGLVSWVLAQGPFHQDQDFSCRQLLWTYSRGWLWTTQSWI